MYGTLVLFIYGRVKFYVKQLKTNNSRIELSAKKYTIGMAHQLLISKYIGFEWLINLCANT